MWVRRFLCALLSIVVFCSVPVSVLAQAPVSAGVNTTQAAKATAKFPQNTVHLTKGKRISVPAVAYNARGRRIQLKYRSANSSVARVSSKGAITARGYGTTKITAYGNGVRSAVLTVRVTRKRVNPTHAFMLNYPSELRIGEQVVIQTAGYPKNATNCVKSYKSSNKSVATVDSAGRVFAKNSGKARITFSFGKKKDYIDITVSESPEKLTKQITAKQYYYNDWGYMQHVLFVTNHSKKTVEISANIVAHNSRGGKIGANTDSVYAVAPGETSFITTHFDNPDAIAKFTYSLYAQEDSMYRSPNKNLQISSNTVSGKAVATVTNKGKEEVDCVELGAVFLKNGKVVGFDHEFIIPLPARTKRVVELTPPFGKDFTRVDFDEVKLAVNSRISSY